MIKNGKVWGSTSGLFDKNNVEINRLEIKKGGFSSRHLHEHKYNMFFVERGNIKIKIWKKDYDLCDETELKNGESSIVEPGEEHMFDAIEDSVVYEIYWVELTKDIIRKNVGGLS